MSRNRFAILIAIVVGAFTGSTPAVAAVGDLFVQVSFNFPFDPNSFDPNSFDPNDPNSFDPNDVVSEGCSIVRAQPNGTLSEWVSNAAILAATGEINANCGDTAITAATDGTLYFAEDVSHDVLRVSPAGAVDVFVAQSAIDAVIGTSSDIDNGMVLGTDGNLYAADEDCDCVIRITVPGGAVSIVVTEAAIQAATGSSPDLEGGLARDTVGNIYLVDDTTDNLLRRTPAGVVSIFAPKSAFSAATGNSGADLDVAIVLGDFLYVADDGDDGDDAILRVHLGTGAVSLLASGAAINAVTGNSDADLEGGLALDAAGNVYAGDDGSGCGSPTPNGECPSIVRVTPAGSVSSFISFTALDTFIRNLYGDVVVTLEGGMVIQRGAAVPSPVPTTSAAGLAGIAGLLLVAAWRRLRA